MISLLTAIIFCTFYEKAVVQDQAEVFPEFTVVINWNSASKR